MYAASGNGSQEVWGTWDFGDAAHSG
jgi:hypothetical protein